MKKRSASLRRLVFGFDLHHVEPEAAVRQLEHARQPQRRNDLVHVAAVHDQRAWRGDAMPVHQLLHVHLVPALEDGLRIVDDRHAERFRPAQELVDDALGARAVEQRVELRQALQCVGADELRLQSDERRRLHEPLQRFLVGGPCAVRSGPRGWPVAAGPFVALPLGGRSFRP